jgi:hypothetical protein
MTILKIEKLNILGLINPYINYCLKIIYLNLVVIGTIGNLVVIFGYAYKSECKKNPTFLAFIILSIIHLVLLYMCSFDFMEIDFVIDVFLNYGAACSAFNVVYRSLLLLEPWQVDLFYTNGIVDLI